MRAAEVEGALKGLLRRVDPAVETAIKYVDLPYLKGVTRDDPPPSGSDAK